MDTSERTLNGGGLSTLISLIKGKVQTLLNTKVDVEDGKGLSTNDYTDTEKNKVALINGRSDSTSASALSYTDTNFPTVRDIYYGLPQINGVHTYTSGTAIYAPTSVGTAGYELVSNGSGAPLWKAPNYATCSTAAATAAKTVSITNFKLVTGARIVVKFTYANTASSPTLNVNSTGAIAIRFSPDGYTINTTDFAIKSSTYELLYNGTYWLVVQDFNFINSLYSVDELIGQMMYWNIDNGISSMYYMAYAGDGTASHYMWSAGIDFVGDYLRFQGNDVLYGDSSGLVTNGTTTWYAPTTVGTSGQILKSTGTGAPSWVTPSYLTLSMNGSSSTYNTSAAVTKTWYAPTTAGTAGYELVSNGSGAPLWKAPSYATCSTAAATAAKTVTLTNFKLYTGCRILVKFTYANTVASSTLNVNSTGAKTIKWGNVTSRTNNHMWQASDIVEFIYDGTYWVAISSTSTLQGYFTDNVTIKGTGNYGTKINLGDSDYCHISEPADDKLEIKGSTVYIQGAVIIGRGYSTTATTAVTLGGSDTSAVYLQNTSNKVVGTTTGYNTKLHVSSTEPSSMAVGDIWFKIPS